MFKLEIKKDNNPIIEPTEEDFVSKLHKFQDRKIDPYRDWFLLKDGLQYRIYGVINCYINSANGSSAEYEKLFNKNKFYRSELNIFVELPVLGNKTLLYHLNDIDLISIFDSNLREVVSNKNKLTDTQVDILTNGIYVNEHKVKSLDDLMDSLSIIGFYEKDLSNSLKNITEKLLNNELTRI